MDTREAARRLAEQRGPRRSTAKPRWATRRRPERKTLGGQVAAIAQMLGYELMHWQRRVADVALEINPDTGLLAYRQVWFSVPRQSGKTTLALPYQIQRCLSKYWGTHQQVAYTAQTGKDAHEKLLDDQVPIIKASQIHQQVAKYQYSKGSAGILFKGNSRIRVLASGQGAGHGKTLDLAMMDEVWEDVDNRREQALAPAMLTKPNAQILGFSTMGTDQSVYFNEKVAIGREAAVADTGAGTAYFEWSVPRDRDIEDPEVWWEFMPALGWTIDEATVRQELESRGEDVFRRSLCNQQTRATTQIFPTAKWQAIQDPDAVPTGRPLIWGIDVIRNIDHLEDASAIACQSGGKVAVIEHRPGIDWIVPVMKRLISERGGVVALDGGGPAAVLVPALRAAGIQVYALTGPQVIAGCGKFYDHVADGTIRVYPDESLDTAVAGAVKKNVGDRFVYSRTLSTTDTTPLYACTLALSKLESPAPFMMIG